MNRPSSIEDRLSAFLEEGPTSGPDDLLTAAHARARSTRQRPAWRIALEGVPMETTWRARPLTVGRLAFALLTALLIVALTAAALVVGSRLLRLGPDDGLNAVPLDPRGGEALLAFTSFTADQESGDVFVVRADGTDVRRLTADPLFDTSPVWSPDGGRIAFYSGGDGILVLRMAAPDGSIHTLADMRGCMDGTNAPAWSPDGRFVLYQADPNPDDDSCESAAMDVYVVPVDGSAEGRRLLAAEQTVATSNPHWVGDRIVMRGMEAGQAQLLLATVTDPELPWDLTAERIESGFPDLVSFGWSRLSPDGSDVATTYIPVGTGFGTAMVVPGDGGNATSLLRDPTKDQIVPGWGPDGTWLTVLELTALLEDHATYRLVVVGRDGSEPRIVPTPELSGNGGPVMVSPDGTLGAARAEWEDGAMPGAILFVDLVGDADPVSVLARGWSSVSWQPVANPDNPAANAPAGQPTF